MNFSMNDGRGQGGLVYSHAVDREVDSIVAPALEALMWHLLDACYSMSATFDICHYALDEGTLAGCPSLDRGDEWLASEAYAGALPEVPYDSPAWGVAGPDEVPDFRRAARDRGHAGGSAPEADTLLPPIAGGGLFEPTDEDWADYRAWAERVDRELPGEPEPPMWGYE